VFIIAYSIGAMLVKLVHGVTVLLFRVPWVG